MVIANEEFLPEDPLENEEDKQTIWWGTIIHSLSTNSTRTTRKGMMGVGLYALKKIKLIFRNGRVIFRIKRKSDCFFFRYGYI